MALDKDALLGHLAGDEPCGPFLEIDERLSRGKSIIVGAQRWAEFKRFPGRFPDPSMQPPEVARNEVDGAIKGLVEFLGSSRDLRAVSFLAQGYALRGQLADLRAALELAVGLIEQSWEYINPRFPDSVYDTAAERIDPLRPLNDGDRLWWLIRESKLIEHPRHGVFTVGDLCPKARPGENAPPPPQGFEAAMAEASPEALTTVYEALEGINNAFASLESGAASALSSQGGEAEEVPAPEFDQAMEELKLMLKALRGRIAVEGDADEESTDSDWSEDAGAVSTGPRIGGVSAPGVIASRDDVVRALESILSYYEIAEPSSPVQIMVMRAKSLVGKSFFEVINDIAPEMNDVIMKLAGAAIAAEVAGSEPAADDSGW